MNNRQLSKTFWEKELKDPKSGISGKGLRNRLEVVQETWTCELLLLNNSLPDMPILDSSSSAANKDMKSKI